MKKKAYRAIEVNNKKLENLPALVGNARTICGIDIAKELNFFSLMTEKHEVLATVKWKHPLQTGAFIELISHFKNVEIVMEPSGTYGDPIRYLLEKKGLPVFRVSPKRSHDAAEVYDGVPSLHDAKSAAIISKLHLDGASEPWKIKQDHERDLHAAITTLDILSDHFKQNLNRIEALMAKYWPEMDTYLKLKSTTVLTLASRIGGPHAVAAQKEEARALMKKVGGNFLSATKIEKIIQSAERTIGIPMTQGELVEFRDLMIRTLALKKDVRASKKKVESLSQDNEATQRVGQVVGKATAAVLVTFSGDPLKYDSCDHWLKSFGLNLKEKSSGKYKGHLGITRRGSGRSRRWLYFSALRMIKNDRIVKAWYMKKVARDGGVRKKAIIAIMRKLVKALWYVAQGDAFDSSRMFDVRTLKLAA